MQITQEWIEDISNGQYDYVMALHTDKYYEGLPHYHVHIIVNPKNKVTGKWIHQNLLTAIRIASQGNVRTDKHYVFCTYISMSNILLMLVGIIPNPY